MPLTIAKQCFKVYPMALSHADIARTMREATARVVARDAPANAATVARIGAMFAATKAAHEDVAHVAFIAAADAADAAHAAARVAAADAAATAAIIAAADVAARAATAATQAAYAAYAAYDAAELDKTDTLSVQICTPTRRGNMLTEHQHDMLDMIADSHPTAKVVGTSAGCPVVRYNDGMEIRVSHNGTFRDCRGWQLEEAR